LSRDPDPERLVTLGKVVRVHGLDGTLRIKSFARSVETFAGVSEVWLKVAGGEVTTRPLERARPHPKGVLIKLGGIDRCEDAEPFVGAEIGVVRSALPELEEGEYYWVDLIGLEVIKEDGSRLGRVKALFETGANDVLVVQTDGEELFIPAVDEAVSEVDLAKGRLVVRDLAGLDLDQRSE